MTFLTMVSHGPSSSSSRLACVGAWEHVDARSALYSVCPQSTLSLVVSDALFITSDFLSEFPDVVPAYVLVLRL